MWPTCLKSASFGLTHHHVLLCFTLFPQLPLWIRKPSLWVGSCHGAMLQGVLQRAVWDGDRRNRVTAVHFNSKTYSAAIGNTAFCLTPQGKKKHLFLMKQQQCMKAVVLCPGKTWAEAADGNGGGQDRRVSPRALFWGQKGKYLMMKCLIGQQRSMRCKCA